MGITMKQWLGTLTGFLAAVALSGCATYGDRQAHEPGTGDTYDERVYADERYDDFTPDLGWAFGHSSAYYPWRSMDYFYLGFHHYRPSYLWGFRHFSPWHPYVYHPWYSSYAGGWPYRWHDPWYGFGGYGPYGYYRYPGHPYQSPGYHQPDPGHQAPEPVGSHGGQHAGSYRPGIEDGIRDRDRMRRSGGGGSDRGTPAEARSSDARSIVVAPRGADGRGMVVIGGRDNKVAPNRLEPVGDAAKSAPAGPPIRSQPRPAVSVAPPRNTPAATPRPDRGFTAPPRQSAPRHPAPARGEFRSMSRPDRGPARSQNSGDDDSGRGAARFRDRD